MSEFVETADIYYCPLCRKIHEFTVPCFEQLDPKFRLSLLLDIREQNDDEVRDDRKESLSKNQMKFSEDTLEDMK